MTKFFRKIKLSSKQIAACLRFRKAINRFLKQVNNFEIKGNEREESIEKTVALRKGILEIKYESIVFLDFMEGWIEGIEKIKFEELKDEDIKKLRISSRRNDNERKIGNGLKMRLPEKLLGNKNFSCIIFHLAEIYADYFGYKEILNDLISKKSIHPDLLHTYLAGDFYGLDWHTFGHIGDLVSFEDGEFIYEKGLMSNLSSFLESFQY